MTASRIRILHCRMKSHHRLLPIASNRGRIGEKKGSAHFGHSTCEACVARLSRVMANQAYRALPDGITP